MRRLPLLRVLLFTALGCSRTPAEPALEIAVNAATVTAPTAKTPRCIKATPEKPPPPAERAATCPADPLHAGALPTVVTLSFSDVSSKSSAVKVEAELARTEDETQRGLMYRTMMAEDRGMLFRLEKHVEHTFWMQNTCIPLDMLFVEDDGLIVGIAENVPTLNEAPRTVGCPSSWVLEVNAGWSRRHGVRAGQKLVIPAAASN